MLPKPKEKELAVHLRKQGFSYSEILMKVPVSQASLSLWLRDVTLSQPQIDHLLLKKINGQSKGAKVRKDTRIKQEKLIVEKAKRDIRSLSRRELFLLGVMAYWCEGSKQKPHNVSQCVVFANSDPFLVKLFIKWLKEVCYIKETEIQYRLYIHESGNEKAAIEYWSNELSVAGSNFSKTVFKKHKILTNRKNIGREYHGLVKVVVRKSTNLNRQITGWVSGINMHMS